MVDGELREGYCLELLSLCHQYVMLAEILREVVSLLSSLIIASLGRCGKAFGFLSLPLTHCHLSCPVLPTEKSEAVTDVARAGPILIGHAITSDSDA